MANGNHRKYLGRIFNPFPNAAKASRENIMKKSMSSLATLPKQVEEEYQWDLAELNQFPKDGLGMLLLKRGMLITEAE